MSVTRRITHRYPAPLATISTLLHNADSLRTRSSSLGETEVEVTVNETPEGFEVTHLRTTAGDLPAFVKKLVKGGTRIEERTRWRRDGDGWRAEYKLEVLGTPGKIQGKSELRPDGDGCQYVTEFVATADIPLIGGKVEGVIADRVEAAMRAGIESNQSRL